MMEWINCVYLFSLFQKEKKKRPQKHFSYTWIHSIEWLHHFLEIKRSFLIHRLNPIKPLCHQQSLKLTHHPEPRDKKKIDRRKENRNQNLKSRAQLVQHFTAISHLLFTRIVSAILTFQWNCQWQQTELIHLNCVWTIAVASIQCYIEKNRNKREKNTSQWIQIEGNLIR